NRAAASGCSARRPFLESVRSACRCPAEASIPRPSAAVREQRSSGHSLPGDRLERIHHPLAAVFRVPSETPVAHADPEIPYLQRPLTQQARGTVAEFHDLTQAVAAFDGHPYR